MLFRSINPLVINIRWTASTITSAWLFFSRLAIHLMSAMVSTGRRSVIRPRFPFCFGGRPFVGLPAGIALLFIAKTGAQAKQFCAYNRLMCVQMCRWYKYEPIAFLDPGIPPLGSILCGKDRRALNHIRSAHGPLDFRRTAYSASHARRARRNDSERVGRPGCLTNSRHTGL